MRSTLIGLLSIVLSFASASACKKASEPRAIPVPVQKASLDKPESLSEKAPDVYRARFATSKGDFVIEVQRDWAPNGADRFFNLVKNGYYDETRFFRVVRGFMAQIGIHGKPEMNNLWRDQRIADDPVKKSNLRGFVSFATAGPGTRTTQFFINFADGNSRLDGMGFAPFGQISSGMDVVDALYAEYGEGAPQGQGPNQGRIQGEGNAYLLRDFPLLDYVKQATILP
jgi:peptidyl-prolyl cis-trans isomerase A (cyclophilin A)